MGGPEGVQDAPGLRLTQSGYYPDISLARLALQSRAIRRILLPDKEVRVSGRPAYRGMAGLRTCV